MSLRQDNVETRSEPGGLVEAVLRTDEEVETHVSAQAAAHSELGNEAARRVAEGFMLGVYPLDTCNKPW